MRGLIPVFMRFGDLMGRLLTTNKGLVRNAFAATTLVLLGSSAFAQTVNLTSEQWQCYTRFQDLVNSKQQLKVPPKHFPVMYLPEGTPRDTVVIFTHGMFESPHFFKGINRVFAREGYISLSILLPGHWEGDWSQASKVRFRDWIKEMNANIDIARCMGKKIIFAGHSLGGLLSTYAALANPEITQALMLWAPAYDLRLLPSIGVSIGSFLNIDGNILMGAANSDELPRYSPLASKQIEKLIQYTANKFGDGKMANVYKKLTVPTFLAYAEKDPAIDVDELTRAAHSIAGIEDVMYFPKKTMVHHGNITKFPGDAYKFKPKDYNLMYLSMKDQVMRFLEKFGR